ncbi:MAG: hypothetical protein ABS939_14470 [Psychrobacillus sp.]
MKKMVPHMAKDLEQQRAILEKVGSLCKVAYENFENERFEEEEFMMSKKLVLGLDYMDTVEYLLFLVDDLDEFSKISTLKGLLIHGSRECPGFTPDGTRVWHNYSDCHGKPINHDRFWVLRELFVGNFDEATLIAKINDFGERANALINFMEIALRPIFESENKSNTYIF